MKSPDTSMSNCPVHRMRHRNAVALELNSTRSQPEFTVRYSGEKVAAVSPACSADRQRVLVWAGVLFPFITMVSVSFHSPGAIPSAAAKGDPRQRSASQAIDVAASDRREAGHRAGCGRLRHHMELTPRSSQRHRNLSFLVGQSQRDVVIYGFNDCLPKTGWVSKHAFSAERSDAPVGILAPIYHSGARRRARNPCPRTVVMDSGVSACGRDPE